MCLSNYRLKIAAYMYFDYEVDMEALLDFAVSQRIASAEDESGRNLPYSWLLSY